jgi:hypothetical protein
MLFCEYDTVRVIKLRPVGRWWDGSPGVSRPPEIGDEGTIVFADPDDPNAPIVVENSDANGYSIWVADLFADEIEVVGRPPARQ